MRNWFLLLAIFICAQAIHAQNLPRGLSAEEKLLLQRGYTAQPVTPEGGITTLQGISTPRSIAEWEELQGIAITWTQYRTILTEIVRHAVKEVTVYVIARDSSDVKSRLATNGIDPDSNLVYIDGDYNSIWIRDFGANPAYTSDVDSLVFVDWIYNRPRPLDDAIPGLLAAHMGIPLLSTTEAPSDLVHTGGNYMTDGLGRGFSSKLVLDENGENNSWGVSNHSEEAVDSLMEVFMGINEYVKMEVLPYDAIHHIDMHMKLLDESTLLVGQYPEGIADGPQIEANIQYVIENFKLATGRDYRVVRIPMPPDQFGRYPHTGGYYRTYANALFVNKTILVPTYDVQYDTTALRIWEETMPGYNIVGIDCNQIIPASGAIHCITKEIGVEGPLWIWHENPYTVDINEGAAIEAIVKHRTGIEAVVLNYRQKGTTEYTQLTMTETSEHTYITEFQQITSGDTIEYFIQAVANNGKEITRPLVAPDGYFELEVVGETSAASGPARLEIESNVFPNPASSLTFVEMVYEQSQHVRIELVSMDGKKVSVVYDGQMMQGQSKVFFDVSEMPAGIYTVSIETDTGRARHKLVVL